MTIQISKVAAFVFVLLSVSKGVSACWAPVSLEYLVNHNPLIVVGQIEKIVEAQPRGDERAYDTAFIRVRGVLKSKMNNPNIKSNVVIRLSMPSINNKHKFSTDIGYKRGTDGIWFLLYDKDRKAYTIGRPDEHQPMKQEKEIMKIIKGKVQPKSSNSAPKKEKEIKIIIGNRTS